MCRDHQVVLKYQRAMESDLITEILNRSKIKMNTSKETKSEYWQDLSRKEKVEKVLKEGYLTDCKFIVGPNKKTETFPGHKVMFIMESPVFEKHFNGNFLEGKNMSEVRIEEFCPKDFKNFYFMIYNSDDVSRQDLLQQLSTPEITELYRICHKYMVSSILKVCFQYIKLNLGNRLSPLKSIILLFGMANELNDVELLTLIEKTIIFHNSNFDEVLNDLPPEYFHKYMLIVTKKQRSVPKELDKFKALEAYILKNNLLVKDTFYNSKKLLELVDLKKMSTKEFISGPGNSKVFDWKTKYDILAHLVTICNQNGYRGYY